MNTRKWGLFVPPSGAAREVMISVARTMELMGEQIVIIDCAAYQQGIEAMMTPESKDMALDIWNQNWVCKALEEQWTHILVGALSPVMTRTLKLWKMINIKLVHWFYEDFRKVDYWKNQAPFYDLYCCVQKEPLSSEIAQSYRFLPTAVETIHYVPLLPAEKKRFTISFVGIPTPYRISVIKALTDAGIPVALAGPNWKHEPTLAEFVVLDGWANDATARELYNLSLMGLNISQEDPAQEREFHQVSPRLYDMAANGTIPVTERLPLGDHILSHLTAEQFDTVDELISIIKRIQSTPFQRDVLERNREIIAGGHTYQKRIEQIIQWLEEL